MQSEDSQCASEQQQDAVMFYRVDNSTTVSITDVDSERVEKLGLPVCGMTQQRSLLRDLITMCLSPSLCASG